jgi:hypothetical protein
MSLGTRSNILNMECQVIFACLSVHVCSVYVYTCICIGPIYIYMFMHGSMSAYVGLHIRTYVSVKH